MNETPFDPQNPPDETDRTLDLYLASLSRFEPGPGFANRVMARVALPPALAVRPWPVRRAGRTLAALSGAAALSSTALTAWVASNLEALAAAVTSVATVRTLAAWQAVVAAVPEMTAWAGERLAAIALTAGPVTVGGVVAGALLSVPIGMFGLYLAARPPLHPRMVTHAAP